MKSITFKRFRDYTNITSVQITLTNGQSSPVFEQRANNYAYKKIIQLEDSNKIRSIKIWDGDADDSIACPVQFLDDKKHLIHSYNPKNVKLDGGTEVKLQAN